MVGAVNRRHVVGIVKEQRQNVEPNRPHPHIRSQREIRKQQQRRRPGSASHDEIEPWIVDPGRSLRLRILSRFPHGWLTVPYRERFVAATSSRARGILSLSRMMLVCVA